MSELSVDLGSANLRVWGPGGELWCGPAVASASRLRCGLLRSRRLLGEEALAAARRGELAVVRPLASGVLADSDSAEALLRAAIGAGRSRFRMARPRLCFAISAQSSDLQLRALRHLATAVGARAAHAVTTPLAVLAGLSADVRAAEGKMVVDVGAATTQVAVVSLASVVVARERALGGEDMDRAIEEFVEQRFGARLPAGAAEQLRIGLCAAQRTANRSPMTIAAEDLASAQQRTIEVHSAELSAAIAPQLRALLALVHEVLAETPPELAADVADAGIVLCGGVSSMPDLDGLLEEATGVRAHRVGDPISASARGLAVLLGSAKYRESLLQEL